MVYRKTFEQYQDYMMRVLMAKSNFEGGVSPSSNVKTVTFQVTDTCNLACTYCYQINKSVNRLTFEKAKKFIDLMFEDSYKGKEKYLSLETTPGIVLEFIGGEPLLEIELIDKITDYFRYKSISLKHPWATRYIISMISNGIEYFNPKVQAYIKKNKGRLSFSMSLDGCKELHDKCRVFKDGRPSYDLVEKACIHHKTNIDTNMLTKMTIAPENIDWTFKAFKNLHGLGYKIIHANTVYEKGWEMKHAKTFYKELKQIADYLLDNNLDLEVYTSLFEEDSFVSQPSTDCDNYCGSTGCMLALDPHGEIYTCIRFMKSSLGNKVTPYSIGHINSGIGVEEIHANRIKELDNVTRQSQSEQKCIECPISRGCGWCTAYNYQATGTINKRVTYICDMHKARSLANVYFWNKSYKKHNEKKRFKMNCPKEWALDIISEEEYNFLDSLTKF